MEAIAAFAYMEMLEAGFTRVGEFHYVHHDRGGRRFSDPAEMAHRIAAARANSRDRLDALCPHFTPIPASAALRPTRAQSRFVTDVDGYARCSTRSRQAVSGLDDAVVGVAPHSLRACHARGAQHR